MSRIFVVVAFALLVSGCSTVAPDPTPAVETVTVTAPAEASANEEPEPSTAPEQTEDPTEEDLQSLESEISDRGNLIKEVGQLAGTVNDETGETTTEFRVDSIVVDYDCPGGPPPENGHYLTVEISLETFPALADGGDDIFLDAGAFTIIAPDGTRENDSLGLGYECESDATRMPVRIGPAEKATGIVVLDTQYDEGFLVLDGFALGSPGGWEWQY